MLENLHQLLLQNCYGLQYVPSLEKLKVLEHFELTHSQIEEVPQGIEELVNLRQLDLSGNHNPGMSPCQKLCKLTQLHNLRIQGTKIEVSAEELLCLKQLKVLEAQFHNVQELTKYVKSGQCKSLERYNLVVGIVDKNNQAKKQERVFRIPSYLHRSKYFSCTGVDAVVSISSNFYRSKYFSSTGLDAVVLPINIEELCISRWDNHISLSDIQSLRAARSLKKISIHMCSKLESVFSSSSPSSSSSSSCFLEDYHIPLTTIEELQFLELPNFRVLFDRVVPPPNISFNLKILEFFQCPKIQNIFSALLLRNFPNLEELDVCDCENVEEIIVQVETSDRGGHREDDGNTITFPNLKELYLENLPRLKSIYKGIILLHHLLFNTLMEKKNGGNLWNGIIPSPKPLFNLSSTQMKKTSKKKKKRRRRRRLNLLKEMKLNNIEIIIKLSIRELECGFISLEGAVNLIGKAIERNCYH
ncbi:Disease resistance protein [Camellia lanceoleosa]|uniref:Disease resistance protein n=1 Tax=Camellia lanceoleosa TaxID=1840588 RepID=A0ACC0IR81_9ERIC|nr:Disease resistance protein [Camellia lanceoleosa]